MADVKISQLPAATTPVSGTEELPLVQSGVTKKIALSDLSSISFGATGLTPATATSGAVVVAGTLDVNNGGTSLTTLTANNVILGNGASAPTFVAPSTSGNVLTSNGTTWSSAAPATSGTVTSVAMTVPSVLSISGSPITSSGTLALTYSGTALPVANGGTGVTTSTGTTNVVLSNSPTLVTPVLGVATATSLQGIIGNVTPAAGNFTTLGASSTATLNTLVSSGATLTGGTINGMTVGATTATTGAFTSLTASTTLGVTGVSTLTGGAVVQGLTVGLGGGAISTNTAVGVSALSGANTAGLNVALGYQALTSSTSGASNTALGYQAGYSASGSSNTFVGDRAGTSVSSGSSNTAVGREAGSANAGATGSNNSSLGYQALYSNTTASNNTAVGYQAGYTNQTGAYNVFVGGLAGQGSTGSGNTFIGGGNNSAGYPAGFFMTGNNSVVIGGYGGNQDSLDIRTSNNYVVLATGNGDRQITMAEGQTLALDSAVPNSGTGITFPATENLSSNANTLDDYEEGTWTPAFAFSTSGSVTYTSQEGYYRKVGSLVFVECNIIIASVSSPTGSVTVNNLPYTTSSSAENVASLAIGIVRSLVNAKPDIKAYCSRNSTIIVFPVNDTTSGSSELQGSDLQAGTLIYVSGCFIAN